MIANPRALPCIGWPGFTLFITFATPSTNVMPPASVLSPHLTLHPRFSSSYVFGYLCSATPPPRLNAISTQSSLFPSPPPLLSPPVNPLHYSFLLTRSLDSPIRIYTPFAISKQHICSRCHLHCPLIFLILHHTTVVSCVIFLLQTFPVHVDYE